MGDKPITLGAFVKDLRWMVPVAVGAMLALWALDVAGMRDRGFVTSVLIGLGFVFVLGPIAWLRFEHSGGGPGFWRFWVGAVLWIFVGLGIVAGVTSLVGIG